MFASDSEDSEMGYHSDEEQMSSQNLEDNVYGMAVASLIRDTARCQNTGPGHHSGIRVFRMVLTLLVLVLNIGLQWFLLVEVKHFVTAKAVHDIRQGYSDFEKDMYTSDHLEKTVNGFWRGDDKANHLGQDAFDQLSEDQQSMACRIPFSQPRFLFVILMIWSFTLVSEMRECFKSFYRCVLRMPTTRSLAKALKPGEGNEVVVSGLTLPLKVAITVVIVIPRMVLAFVLLWLGCRWLTATANFADMLVNAVALEFIIMLKELLYNALVPARNKRDVESTLIDVSYEKSVPSPWTFLGSFFLLVIVVMWVYLYVYYFQQVLPDYRWDIHGVCESWVAKRFAV